MIVMLRLQTKDVVSEVPIEIYKSIVVGRSIHANHKVLDELMSGTHCRITLTHSKLEVTDLESKNGTYLNGLRVDRSDVFLGDEIRIGATKITILHGKMDPESIAAITFLGAAKDRQSHGLKLDFTGARMLNQELGTSSDVEKRPTMSSNKELEVRKVVKSKIKLSKQEIILRNKKRASLASTIDIILVFCVIALPLIASNLIILFSPSFVQENRLIFMLTSVVVCVGLYFILNFKIFKFTTGEKLSGIEHLFNNQEV
jgi:hypothetical protein